MSTVPQADSGNRTDMLETFDALRLLVKDAIRNHPRTLQAALGPSDIACSCDRCLIHALAGHRTSEDAPWLPTIGTAVHEWLEMAVLRHQLDTGTARWVPEGKVTVGHLRGQPVIGTADLYDAQTGTVLDYKVVGATTLNKVRAEGPSLTYQRQVHLYGAGYVNAGYDVNRVSIWFLPRNRTSIDDGLTWTALYNPTEAADTLERAQRLAGWVDTFGAAQVLAAAPPHTGTEFGCNTAPDAASRQVNAEGFLGI